MNELNRAFSKHKVFRLHLTNVVGLGAVQLIQSLLPKLVALDGLAIAQVYIAAKQDSIDLGLFGDNTKITTYNRRLPRAISRFIECTMFGGMFG